MRQHAVDRDARIRAMAEGLGLKEIHVRWAMAYGLDDRLLQPECPRCGDEGQWLIGATMVGQVFCSNDDCDVWMWNPRVVGGGREVPLLTTDMGNGSTYTRPHHDFVQDEPDA